MATVPLQSVPSDDVQSLTGTHPDIALQPSESVLADAFALFRDTAKSLEGSYARLQAEVGRLRRELDQTHRALEKERDQSRRHHALVEVSTMLAHEIRNPLASLELFAGLLLESGLSGEQQEWIEHMQAGIRTLGATVHNVLQWHSPGQTEFVTSDFGKWLDDVAGFLSPLAQQVSVQLVVENRLHGITSAADPHALKQMALNIALNAYRAMPDGGTLRLRGAVVIEHGATEEIWLEFQDSGCGIAPEDLTKIFQAGFSTMSGSPGLGLAVCRAIAERHGGRFSVRNLEGRGACFRVQLPITPALSRPEGIASK